jgi:phospholipase/carboxylesterase
MSQQSTEDPNRPGNGWIATTVVAVLKAVDWFLCFFAPRPDTHREFLVNGAHTGADKVRVDCFFPRERGGWLGNSPAVIMLHGVEGGVFLRSRHFRDAWQIAREGYAVFFVCYFDPLPYDHLLYMKTGFEVDTEKVNRHIIGDKRADRQVWIAIAKEAVAWAEQQPEVDPDRLALLGYSLGGMVALSTADECMRRRDPPGLRCVVLNWSARFEDVILSDRIPPVQFLHGEQDPTVPVEAARQTAAELEAMGVPTEVISYPRGKHVLLGQAATHSLRQARRFLDRHLNADRS